VARQKIVDSLPGFVSRDFDQPDPVACFCGIVVHYAGIRL